VTSTDFYPTMLEMAQLPLRPEQHIDGLSMVSLLKQQERLNRRILYWHYPHYGNQGGFPGSAIRSSNWKLIESFEDGRLELFNLKDDIGEKNNLAASMPAKAAELHKALEAWRDQVGARYPRKRS
ncbi:MAG: sulfatase/phosphatase domain-containing protein, partial [Planctomycetota bacterium]